MLIFAYISISYMEFIDTHAHLYLDEFKSDIDLVIRRARQEGISKIILPNIDSHSIRSLHELSGNYTDLFVPLMGLHPTHVKENYLDELSKIFHQLSMYSYSGVGEIGIDLYWDKTHIKEQVDAFRQQLFYALRNNLPVVIHARESFHEILEIVKTNEFAGLNGIFHAFTGDKKLAELIVGMGFKLGIGGILTFKNSFLKEAIQDIGLEHIVLETDSPYLAPMPFRGKRNESGYLLLVARKLAEIKKCSVEEVAEVTTHNAKMLFNL